MHKISERIPHKFKPIYALIQKQGIVSKHDLLEQSGITVSTLTRMLEEMTALGMVQEYGHGESTGGRKPILYRTNPTYAYVFGFDISRAYSRLILCDMHLNQLDSASWMMNETMTPDKLLAAVLHKMKELIEKNKLKHSSIVGIGIGAVGPIDRHQGVIAEPLYFLAPGWKYVEVSRFFEERLDIPVLLDNGANAAVLGEYWAALPNTNQHLLYVRTGVGLRSAMISNGKLVYGAVDMEGAAGQMIIQTDGISHRLRKNSYGCLESYVSTFALEQNAQSLLKQGRKSIVSDMIDDPEKVDFHHLIKALQLNDPMVTEIFTQAATYFGIGLANLLNILHPEKVILGGPLISEHEMFYQISTQVALKHTYYYPDYKVTFSRGKLAEDALATGAAVMVMQAMTE